MTFAQFYQLYVTECDEMGADKCYAPGDETIWHSFTTHQLIDMLVAGKVQVGDVGDELANRGALDQVPGDTWGP